MIDRAGARAREAYARAHGHLMTKPPHVRWLYIAAGLLLLLVTLFALWIALLFPLTPGIEDVKQARVARATVVVSADGRQLASFEQGVQMKVPLSQVSPNVVNALIATEDHRFYDHHGVDFTRIGGALVASLKGDPQGGSTITQQLARNMFRDEIGRARNINRKLKELITAFKIENTYSKPEILEAYLNTVPFLYNTYGIEAAAHTYFNKTAAQLNETEAATLVGMLKGTAYYNPVTNPERSLARRNVVLGQMLKAGVFDEARYRQLVKRPLRVHFARLAEHTGRDDHFTAYVRRWLVEWADKNDADLQQDGLVVQTTLDYDLQQAALQAVKTQAGALQAIADVDWAHSWPINATTTQPYVDMRGGVNPFEYYWSSHGELLETFVRESASYRKAVDGGENPVAALKRLKADRDFMRQLKAAKSRLEAGFLAMDPNTGEIKAWVGSRDFEREQYDHVSQAARQPGSTFKPIVYAAALEKGIAPDHPYLDAVTTIRFADGTEWRPTDNSGTTGRQLTLRDGLVYSKNTITAQVVRDIGVAPVVKLAQDLGVRTSKLAKVPSIALGTSPVTLLEMVNAYSTIAAQGEYRKPVFVRRITDRNGQVVADFGQQTPQRVLSQESAVTLIDMMRGVINRGTGTGIRYRFGITADVAGKTGTTQNNADAWFIMMHPNLVAGAWVGFNDNRVTMRSNYWGQGGHSAILLVGDFFKSVLGSGKISADALFPGGHKPEPVIRHEEAPPEEDMEEGGDMQQEGGPPADTPQPPDNEAPAPPQPELQQEGITLPPPNDA
ncbi:penicillin-binding protein [Massilia sp. TW-1]|uniref:Penicillin-binding protein n=2 Tax=Telluria antibiotica TaxID=2717319 RepID=A0ABX0PBA2_9BURK|nr:transglycosylase domain-containing protein [Telluria antibiotica]NIA54240.1 penicillin-binding protein [Telluria antibiotica]